MIRTRFRLPPLLLLLLLGLAVAASAQLAEDYRFRGKVTDTEGNGLADVVISFRDTKSGRKIEFKTNKKGEFDRRLIPHAVYEVTFVKEGYVAQTQQYDWSQATQETVVKEATVALASAAQQQAMEAERAKAEMGKKVGKLYQEAYEALNAGDCPTATARAQEILDGGQVGSFEYAVRFVLARCLAMGKDLAGAEAAYRRVAELKPDLFEAQFDLAGVLEQAGKHDDAIAAYRRAAEIKAGDVDVHYNPAAILFRAGRFDEAVPLLRRTIELNPGHAQAHKALGFALLSGKEKDSAAAAQSLARYLELTPDAPDKAQVDQLLKELESSRNKPARK